MRTSQEEKNIEGVIMGLMRQLQQLAPHPDHSHFNAPAFSNTKTLQNAPFKLGYKQAISPGFNLRAGKDILLQAYLRDLPLRLGIERWLAIYERKLYALRKHAPSLDFSLTA